MNALECEGVLSAQGEIKIPEEVARQLPAGTSLRLVVLWDGADDAAWRETARRNVESAYSAEDSVYEALLNERDSG